MQMDEKLIFHVCKNLNVYLLQIDEGGDGEELIFDSVVSESVLQEEEVEAPEDKLHISTHAMSSSPSPNTMRLMGMIGVHPIVIMVDS